MSNLVTIPNVELVEVGEDWHTSTGDFTWTHEDLVAAIGALDDPAVRTPVIKLGHTDPRFDGQPSFGRIENMRLSSDGMTLVGDYVGVPEWMAEVMASAWPRRSVEGWFNYTSATGRQHKFVVTGMSLLGAEYPAITTLEDIKAVYGAEAAEDVEWVAATQGQGELIVATKVAAALDVDQVRRQYYGALTNEQGWWWIRAVQLEPNQLIVDDDEGGLYRVPFTVNGDEAAFEDPVAVVIEYRDKAVAAAASARQPLAVYATREDSRPDTLANKPQEAGMTEDQLKAIGLATDASDEQVNERLAHLASLDTKPGEGEPNEGEPDEGEGEGEVPAAPGSAPTTVPQQHDGAVLVDAAQWADTQRQLAAATALVEEDRKRKRDVEIENAVKAGKFPPARKDHYRKLWDTDPEGTQQTLATLEPGLIPVSAVGRADSGTATANDDAYPSHWTIAGAPGKAS